MQYLVLARHGNTFAPGQKVVWVGCRNDLPLVESGIAQAHDLAQALKAASIKPEIIYASKLQRASKYAQIIHDDLHLIDEIKIDDRLNEIDYGSWSGLSDAEIIEKSGASEIEQWKQGVWPKSFIDTELNIENRVKAFVEETIVKKPERQIVLAITSNGLLKYFLKLVPAAYNERIKQLAWKVATGAICILAYENNWHLIAWGEKPQQLCNYDLELG